MKRYLLFDLDGTLTDPKVGITTCVQYALKHFGIDEPDLDKLEPFIGPPLKDSFMQFYQMDEEQAEAAIEKYRERFQDTGIFENKVYDGIPKMLKALQSKGMRLGVASSKPTVYVRRILEHFQLAQYFEVVVGSELDGTRVEKEEVLQEALNLLFAYKPIRREQVYMIGDRRFDIEGAKSMGVESVGVAYGYGGMEELKAAKADYIVRSVAELQKFLLRGTEEAEFPSRDGEQDAARGAVPGSGGAPGRPQGQPGQRPKSTFWQLIWPVLYPLLLFICFTNLARYVIALALGMLGDTLHGTGTGFLFIYNESGEWIGATGNAGAVMDMLAFLASGAILFKQIKASVLKAREEMHLAHLRRERPLNYLLGAAAVAGLGLGLTILINLSGMLENSDAYGGTATQQFSANLLMGLLCYGIVTPLVEEMVFRGVIYNRLKRFMNVKFAIVLSAFLFGWYHMNSVQGLYGFAMGCLFAYAYEYYGTVWAPVLMHIGSNALAYCLSYWEGAKEAVCNEAVCGGALLVAALALWMLGRQKKV